MGIALAVSMLALLALLARPLGTDDTWWHLAMGRMYASEGLWHQLPIRALSSSNQFTTM